MALSTHQHRHIAAWQSSGLSQGLLSSASVEFHHSFVLTPAQWNWLIAGVDWQRLSALPPAHLKA